MKKALLVHPEFSPFGFWNYKDVCRLVGAEYPASPLGLITMAALLPRDWEIKLVDMNADPLHDSQIDWADLVFIGGMLPQQTQFLELIDRVHARGKKVVAGGPSPTSQPHIYENADYLVLGEAECSVPRFLEALEDGATSGTYVPTERPPMADSPVPRFDLLNLNSYLMIGVQFSRGCPFNCEFCDIIELYGRTPRTKTPQQVLEELDALYRLGYRGHVDFVDDNFIGHRKKAKEILRAVRDWSERHRHPFFFSTEASLNIADDDELLDLMAELDFRYVFIGIESPDQAVLKSTKKTTNLNRDLVNDLHKIYRRGIVVNGGFILGFDNETRDSAGLMVDLIREGKICLAMVGLLYALPNTQLTRRLRREGRLLDDFDTFDPLAPPVVDQVSSGINFVTKRPRAEVIHDFLFILDEIYSTRDYFDRCLQLSQAVRIRTKYKPSARKILRYARAFLLTVAKLGLRPSTAWYYWRNLGIVLLTRPSSVETVVNLMAMYIHFHTQLAFVTEEMRATLRALDRSGRESSCARAARERPCAVEPDRVVQA